jgi:hypothetical protein
LILLLSIEPAAHHLRGRFFIACLTFYWRLIFSDLPSPADPAFAAEAAASAE